MKNHILKVPLILIAIGSIASGDPPGAGYMAAGSVSSEGAAKTSAATASGAPSTKPNSHEPFYIYVDKGNQQNHFAPSGWMGDFGDIQMDDASKDHPHEGSTCFKITYSAKGSQGANWAGIYWQEPVNNWGNRSGGFDLSKYKKLTFWARGAQGGEKISEFKVGGISGENGDSDSATIGPVSLTKDWKEYTIDLSGKNLSHIIGGFAWSANRDNNPQGFTFYLDQIRFES